MVSLTGFASALHAACTLSRSLVELGGARRHFPGKDLTELLTVLHPPRTTYDSATPTMAASRKREGEGEEDSEEEEEEEEGGAGPSSKKQKVES